MLQIFVLYRPIYSVNFLSTLPYPALMAHWVGTKVSSIAMTLAWWVRFALSSLSVCQWASCWLLAGEWGLSVCCLPLSELSGIWVTPTQNLDFPPLMAKKSGSHSTLKPINSRRKYRFRNLIHNIWSEFQALQKLWIRNKNTIKKYDQNVDDDWFSRFSIYMYLF